MTYKIAVPKRDIHLAAFMKAHGATLLAFKDNKFFLYYDRGLYFCTAIMNHVKILVATPCVPQNKNREYFILGLKNGMVWLAATKKNLKKIVLVLLDLFQETST